jgi:Flp pilus assembly protein TadG
MSRRVLQASAEVRGFGVSGWRRFWTGQGEGSSLIETALVMPVLILMLCFAVDIGYFFIVAANLVSSSRNAVLYSGQGFT